LTTIVLLLLLFALGATCTSDESPSPPRSYHVLDGPNAAAVLQGMRTAPRPHPNRARVRRADQYRSSFAATTFGQLMFKPFALKKHPPGLAVAAKCEALDAGVAAALWCVRCVRMVVVDVVSVYVCVCVCVYVS
jgi:hypothetical protein